MAKEKGFAEKAAKAAKKHAPDFVMARVISTVPSGKAGHFRFQERMVRVPAGQTLDAVLKGESSK